MDKQNFSASSSSVSASLIILATIGVFYVLVVGKAFLVPLAVAIMVWYIINALSRTYTRFIPGFDKPNVWTQLLSVISVGFFAYFAIDMVRDNIVDVSNAAPTYKKNFDLLSMKLVGKFGLESVPNLNEMLSSVEIAPLIKTLAGSFTNMISNVFLVLFYVLFLLLEQSTFSKKIGYLFKDENRKESVLSILNHTQSDIQTYIWIKTLTSCLTGTISYIILFSMGVDFAGFWAFTIFLLNFIPTIGSIIATLFPALLALLQFETLVPFFVVLIGVGAVQVLVGNFLEPKLMGNTLNLSPFVVMISLTLWGSIWGIAGMFLSVPITVMLLIIFAHFQKTRPIAVLLSGDGNLKFAETDNT